MPKALNASTQINFSAAGDGAGLRLVEDQDRKAEAESRITPSGFTVSCTTQKYVRLYPPATGTTKVTPVSGSISRVGDAVEHDVAELVTFQPGNSEYIMSRGVENVRVELVGAAYGQDGKPTSVNVTYDPVKNALVLSASAFAVCRVLYDAKYSLYLYTFSGECPDDPPPRFDDSGNALPYSEVRYFDYGLIAAIDTEFNAYATLQMEPPTCAYTTISTSWLDSDKDKVVPTIKLEIDPDFPPRIVAAGGLPVAECCIRAYPAGAVTQFDVTAGDAIYQSSVQGVRQCAEVKTFQNSATAALDYPPAGDVEAEIIGDMVTLSTDNAVSYVRGPGEEIVDVTYIEGGNGRYENPRVRTLGPNEMALCDMFNHPVPAHGLAKVKYSATYDRFVYSFAMESGLGISFKQAFFTARDSLGRAAALALNPPSMKDKSRSAR